MKLALFIVAIVYISSGNVCSANPQPRRPECPKNGLLLRTVGSLLYANDKKHYLASRHLSSRITDEATAYNNILATHDGHAAALSRFCSCAHEGFVCLDNRIVEYILALTIYEDVNLQVYEVAGGCNCKYDPDTVVVTVNNEAFEMRKSSCEHNGGIVLSEAKALYIDCGFDGYEVID